MAEERSRDWHALATDAGLAGPRKAVPEKPENCACSHILLGPAVASMQCPGWSAMNKINWDLLDVLMTWLATQGLA